MADKRSHSRVETSVAVELHPCDARSWKPMGPPVAARLVDLSSRGARLEISGGFEAAGLALSPGGWIGITSAEPLLSFGTLHLSVVWSTRVGLLGARFGGEPSDARDALLQRGGVTAEVDNPRMRRHASAWTWFTAALVVAALGGSMARARYGGDLDLISVFTPPQAQGESANSAPSLVVPIQAEGEPVDGIHLGELSLRGDRWVATLANLGRSPRELEIQLVFECADPSCICAHGPLRLEASASLELSCPVPRVPVSSSSQVKARLERIR